MNDALGRIGLGLHRDDRRWPAVGRPSSSFILHPSSLPFGFSPLTGIQFIVTSCCRALDSRTLKGICDLRANDVREMRAFRGRSEGQCVSPIMVHLGRVHAGDIPGSRWQGGVHGCVASGDASAAWRACACPGQRGHRVRAYYEATIPLW